MKARENVFSFLLANHPLDCPICDQAGECDLQDQTKKFATNSSRFFYKKRAVVDKSTAFGLKTIMTRCIHCTRCVRYTSLHTESLLGIFMRGSTSQIGQYHKKTRKSIISASVTEYCPVFCSINPGEQLTPAGVLQNPYIRKIQKVFNFLILCSFVAGVGMFLIILYTRYVLHGEFLYTNMQVILDKIIKDTTDALMHTPDLLVTDRSDSKAYMGNDKIVLILFKNVVESAGMT